VEYRYHSTQCIVVEPEEPQFFAGAGAEVFLTDSGYVPVIVKKNKSVSVADEYILLMIAGEMSCWGGPRMQTKCGEIRGTRMRSRYKHDVIYAFRQLKHYLQVSLAFVLCRQPGLFLLYVENC
jgi:hypothetical protein